MNENYDEFLKINGESNSEYVTTNPNTGNFAENCLASIKNGKMSIQNITNSMQQASVKQACDRIINDDIIDAMRQDETSRSFIGERVIEIITGVLEQVHDMEIGKITKQLDMLATENSSIKSILQTKGSEFKEAQNKQTSEKKSAYDKSRKLESENGFLKDECNNLTKKIDLLKSNHEVNINKRLEPQLKQREADNEEFSKLQNKIYQQEKTIRNDQNLINDLDKEKCSFTNTISELKDRLESIDLEKIDIRMQLEEYTALVSNLRLELDSNQNTAKESNKGLKDKEYEIEDYRNRIEELLREKDETERNLKENIENLQMNIFNSTEKYDEKDKEKSQLIIDYSDGVKYLEKCLQDQESSKNEMNSKLKSVSKDYEKQIHNLEKYNDDNEQKIKTDYEERISKILKEHCVNLETLKKQHEERLQKKMSEIQEDYENRFNNMLVQENEIKEDLESKIQANYENSIPINVHKQIISEKNEIIEKLSLEVNRLTEKIEQMLIQRSENFNEIGNSTCKNCDKFLTTNNDNDKDDTSIKFSLEETVREKEFEIELLKKQVNTQKLDFKEIESNLNQYKISQNKIQRDLQDRTFTEQNIMSENKQQKELKHKSEEECFELLKQIKSLKILNMTVTEEKSLFEEKVNALEFTKNSILKDNESLKLHVQDYTDVIGQQRQNNAKNFEDYYSGREKIAELQEEANLMKTKDNNSNEEINRLRDANNELKNGAQSTEKELKDSKNNYTKLATEKNILLSENSDKDSLITQLKSDISHRSVLIETKDEAIKKLEESHNKHSNNKKKMIEILKSIKGCISTDVKQQAKDQRNMKILGENTMKEYFNILCNEIQERVKQKLKVSNEYLKKDYEVSQQNIEQSNQEKYLKIEAKMKEIMNAKEGKIFELEERIKKMIVEKGELMKANKEFLNIMEEEAVSCFVYKKIDQNRRSQDIESKLAGL